MQVNMTPAGGQTSYFSRRNASGQSSKPPQTSSAVVATILSAQTTQDENSCIVCSKRVYLTEKIEFNGNKFHKGFGYQRSKASFE